YMVAKDVQSKAADRGIVICFTGIGMSMIANKVKGVRCALVCNKDAAVLTREHNDSNCLALSAKYTGPAFAKEIVDLWLNTEFSHNERHQRRIDKITKYEEEF
ncbi:MAG: RpiB/LacA/LacB family sugar-phosphate isomerase, partial [Acholeplasmatales bacterium]|nr:RpiB/LacA/LacB family sugar-phosphate isomerase [Acholeplasmatales bacterium]